MSTHGKDTEKKTLVEEGTQFKGSLSSACPVVVRGRVEGDLTAPALTVSSTGAVHGKSKVGHLHSEGELAGEFDADVVQLSGVVKDNTIVRAKSLEVKLAAEDGKLQVIFGECSVEVGDMPVKDAPLPSPTKSNGSIAPGPIVAEAAEATEAKATPSVPPPA